MNSDVHRAALAELSSRFTGVLLTPENPAYEEARHVHNGLIDRRPTLIARCRGTADVVDAVSFARTHRMVLAVRGGGHNVAGHAVCDGGMMLDLSLMKGISVDPTRRIARAQGGVTWRELNRETQAHGLAVTGGVISTTGIAGLTLGGGLGWLMGKYGLALDNLSSAEVVTAASQIVRAGPDEHADLFWAIRGGGGNFGVVPWFEYRLHPVGRVTSGLAVHAISRARDVIRLYRDVAASASDDLTLSSSLLHSPDGSGTPVAALLACHIGPLADGEAALRPLKHFGTPIMDTLGPASYEATNTMLDDSFPRGALNYWKAAFLTELSDAAIDTLVAGFAECPSILSSLVLEHFHGAAAQVAVGDTAFPHRHTAHHLIIASQWRDRRDSERNIAWARRIDEVMRPYAMGRYVNYMPEGEPENVAAPVFGPNHARLQAIKTRYDPTNLFRLNHNVRPVS